MASSERQFAIVTGASSGIGYHLARECAQAGFDLLVAADRSEIQNAAADFRGLGVEVEALEVDLARTDGVDRLVAAARGRPVDALLANAGHGLGKAFLDQDFDEVRHVIDTNVTGTIYLLQRVGREMRTRGSGDCDATPIGVPCPSKCSSTARTPVTSRSSARKSSAVSIAQ